MKHLTRDLLTMPSASCPGTNMYALAIFLLGCGGYLTVGQTSFDLSLGNLEVAHGIGAGLNTGGGPHVVSLPLSTHVVSAADVDRLLVLRSQLYPTHNSGVFRILSIDSGSNSVTVDYRTATSAPPEADLSWRLYVDEVTASATWRSGSNGTDRYGSWSPMPFVTASASRIVLQSPDVTSWQVRMCLESSVDVAGAVPCGFSIAPGYGGNSNGDFFPIAAGSGPGQGQSLFLHAGLHFNTTSSAYNGMVVGLTPCLTGTMGQLWSTGQWRISMVVDDVSGTCGIVNRNVSLPVPTSGSGWAVFGLCENESAVPSQNNLADPTLNCSRLFVVGSSRPSCALTWDNQFHVDDSVQLVGFGDRGTPVPGVLSCYSDISNPATHVRHLTASSDSSWSSETELFDVEVLVGVSDQTLSASGDPLFPLQPRRLGRLPIFLQGRANLPAWSGLGPSASYYHTLDGVCMGWGGPLPTGDVTGSNASVVSGSYETGQGMFSMGISLPGFDPVVEEAPAKIGDIDATRYRKTYSFFRQVPVMVGVVKG